MDESSARFTSTLIKMFGVLVVTGLCCVSIVHFSGKLLEEMRSLRSEVNSFPTELDKRWNAVESSLNDIQKNMMALHDSTSGVDRNAVPSTNHQTETDRKRGAADIVKVTVPDYPSLSQLESGWRHAFARVLTMHFGTAPTMKGTTTYVGSEGEIVVVSSYTVGATTGSILGLAFNPYTATDLGGGAYKYEPQNAPFTCRGNGLCTECALHERTFPDASFERWCTCPSGTGDCTLLPLEDVSGSYKIHPEDYGSLPKIE